MRCIDWDKLHRPMHFILLCLSTASVTMPLGLVKLINQASGQSSSMSRQISRITGIVRKALANPPALLVS